MTKWHHQLNKRSLVLVYQWHQVVQPFHHKWVFLVIFSSFHFEHISWFPMCTAYLIYLILLFFLPLQYHDAHKLQSSLILSPILCYLNFCKSKYFLVPFSLTHLESVLIFGMWDQLSYPCNVTCGTVVFGKKLHYFEGTCNLQCVC
jgi:hypothetical protein